MQARERMNVADGICCLRAEGHARLVDAVEAVTAAIAQCRERGISKLLVDLRRLEGLAVPTLADRFWMVQDWAQASQGRVAVAMVVRPEQIDPGKFGVMAAADAGLKSDVFTSDAPALAWLKSDGVGGAESVRSADLPPESPV